MNRTTLQVVGNVDATSPKISATREGNEILVRLAVTSVAPVDELRPVTQWAQDFGLEVAGLRRAIARAGALTVKIGRAVCIRRSDLLAIVDRLAHECKTRPKATGHVAADYDAIVAQARGRRR